MNTTKKSSLDNSPYQNARTSPLEPKARKMRSTTTKGPRAARSSSDTDPYSAAPKAKERRKSTGTAAPYVYGQVSNKGERKNSTYENKRPNAKASRPKAAEPERSVAEDAEILRRFKSLMQQGADKPVVSDPYPSYQVDEMGNVIHQKGSSRPKAEVKVVVRRKRPLINEPQDEVLNQDPLKEIEEAAPTPLAVEDNILKAAAQIFTPSPEQEGAKTDNPKAKKRTTKKEPDPVVEVQNQDIADNLLRAAAIVFAQDPVMGVSKEQSLALGITSNVANAILQEQNPNKKKKRNKPTAAQKAEAEAAAAAAAAAEAAAIVALSKRFSNRNISQAESSLALTKNNYQAVAVDPIEGDELEEGAKRYHSRYERLNLGQNSSTQELLNKLARTQAQLEKDDTLPDNFELDYEDQVPSKKRRRTTKIAETKSPAKRPRSRKDRTMVAESDGLSATPVKRTRARKENTEVAESNSLSTPSVKRTSARKENAVVAEGESLSTTPVKRTRTSKKSTTKADIAAPEVKTIVETKSTILSGANDTAITIKVKRRSNAAPRVSSSQD